MINHIVSDFVIRIKNAAMARRHEVIVPFSNINKAMGTVLVKEHFLESMKEEVIDGKKMLRGIIRFERRHPVVTDVEIISKPSLRVYSGKSETIVRERKRKGTVILSTSKGVITGKEARKKGVGGELLFEIW